MTRLGSTTKFASNSALDDPLIRRYFLQSVARELLPDERVALCMRVIRHDRNSVDVVYNRAKKKAGYRGVIRCGSVWTCAVCAATITEARRQVLSDAIKTSGLTVVMITYTLSHERKDTIDTVLNMLMKAYKAMKSGRSWVSVKAQFSWVGSVKALEVTYGVNGWHPHIHELVFFDAIDEKQVKELESEMRARWLEMVDKRGGYASVANGLRATLSNDDIAWYVEKFGQPPQSARWSLEQELTKAPVKRGRVGGKTPVELLIDYADGDKRAGRLFIEYARAFKGRSQLQWSRGLKERLGIDDPDEMTLVENEETEAGVILATLSREQWRLIVMKDARAKLLKLAETGDSIAVIEFVTTLEGEQ